MNGRKIELRASASHRPIRRHRTEDGDASSTTAAGTQTAVVLHRVERVWGREPAATSSDFLFMLPDTAYSAVMAFSSNVDAMQMSRSSHTHFHLMLGCLNREPWHLFNWALSQYMTAQSRPARSVRPVFARNRAIGWHASLRLRHAVGAVATVRAPSPRAIFERDSRYPAQCMLNEQRIRNPEVQRAAQARSRTALQAALLAFGQDPENRDTAIDLAESFARHGQWPHALALMDWAEQHSPNDWQVHAHFSRILLEAGDGRNAVVHARRAWELSTGLDSISDMRAGWVAGLIGRAMLFYARQLKVAGKNELAKAYLEKVLRALRDSEPVVHPESCDAWSKGCVLSALAMILHEMGQADEAERTFNELVSVGEPFCGLIEASAFLGKPWTLSRLIFEWSTLDGASAEYALHSPFTSSLHNESIWPHLARSLGMHPEQTAEVFAGLEMPVPLPGFPAMPQPPAGDVDAPVRIHTG